MDTVFHFPDALKRDPAVNSWMKEHRGELGDMARHWFNVMRDCGDDVRELLHDGHPTACVTDATLAHVNPFTAHVNVGFFRGAEVKDPAGLLEGTGKYMRHLKLRPGSTVDAGALMKLIETAYTDTERHLRTEQFAQAFRTRPIVSDGTEFKTEQARRSDRPS